MRPNSAVSAKNGVLSCGYGVGAEGFYRRFCRHVEGGMELAARIIGVYRDQRAADGSAAVA